MITDLFPTATTWPLATQWEDGWYPGNPSIAEGPDGYAALVTCRDLHRDENGNGFQFADPSGTIRTRNFFAHLTETLRPSEAWRELKGPHLPCLFQEVRGIEDPRLYWDKGWRYTGSIREHHPSGEHRVARCDVDFGLISVLDAPEGVWVKNQMPTGSQPEFVDAMASNPSHHGGAVCAHNTGWLGVIHEVEYLTRQYHHRFAIYDQTGQLTRASKRFTFGRTLIEFAAGIVRHGEDVVVSYGVQDQQCWLARIPLTEVLTACEP